MTLNEVMSQLQALGSEKAIEMNTRHGVSGKQFGVKNGDLRPIAKAIKSDPELTWQLWDSEYHEARMLATLIWNPKKLTEEEVERLVSQPANSFQSDWLNSNVMKALPNKEAFRLKWMTSTDPMTLRSAWSLTTERVVKNREGLDLTALLDRIEKEMLDAPEANRWMMNYCLAEIGINSPEHRDRAIAIGEKLGVYRDYKVSKGCTSPFAPIWIKAMVDRAEATS